MVVADGLVPNWHQDICNHRDDVALFAISGVSIVMVTKFEHKTNLELITGIPQMFSQAIYTFSILSGEV